MSALVVICIVLFFLWVFEVIGLWICEEKRSVEQKKQLDAERVTLGCMEVTNES